MRKEARLYDISHWQDEHESGTSGEATREQREEVKLEAAENRQNFVDLMISALSIDREA